MPLPIGFDVEEVRLVLSGETKRLSHAFVWSGDFIMARYWSDVYLELRPLTDTHHAILEAWVKEWEESHAKPGA
jgi:hypothetical protein